MSRINDMQNMTRIGLDEIEFRGSDHAEEEASFQEIAAPFVASEAAKEAATIVKNQIASGGGIAPPPVPPAPTGPVGFIFPNPSPANPSTATNNIKATLPKISLPAGTGSTVAIAAGATAVGGGLLFMLSKLFGKKRR